MNTCDDCSEWIQDIGQPYASDNDQQLIGQQTGTLVIVAKTGVAKLMINRLAVLLAETLDSYMQMNLSAFLRRDFFAWTVVYK